jgi:hypothetical protein
LTLSDKLSPIAFLFSAGSSLGKTWLSPTSDHPKTTFGMAFLIDGLLTNAFAHSLAGGFESG